MIRKIPTVKETVAFCVRETTAGTLVQPTASDFIAISGSPTSSQTPETMDNPEIFSSLSIIERCKTQNKAGTWSIPIVLHCAGAAGSEPNETLLMEAAFGLKTVSAGTDVEYALAKEKPSLSLWYSLGHTTFFMSGATVDQVSFDSISPATNCYVNATFSGQFMRHGWVTSCPLISIEASPCTWGTIEFPVWGGECPILWGGDSGPYCSTVTVGTKNISGFCIGGLVSFEDADGSNVDNNSGAGYKIIAVNYAAGTFTVAVSPTYAGGAGGHVKAFVPSVTPTSVPLPAKYLGVKINTAYTNVVSFGLTVAAKQFYFDDEATNSGYPESYTGTESRQCDVTMTAYFRPEWSNYLKTINDNETVLLEFVSDSTKTAAGERLSIPMPRFRINEWQKSESNGVYQVTITGTADGTSGEDELTISYS